MDLFEFFDHKSRRLAVEGEFEVLRGVQESSDFFSKVAQKPAFNR